ncbi:MAG: hypothetical protein IAE77_27895 [Prosthecobacter sp.]|jgi:hypothetical protein|uniref:hypothetical protein n=1 Tax=Prosthecobacter sp. TaxID=1965333 RepID=UPI0019EAC1FA|nr:hypothetical protein [Prosthecobacter sp.]MBE2287309.1 hypothetical protein [Prosthecobacter sp.]
MNPPPSLLAAAITMPDISPYLTKGADAGSGVTLHVGDPYVWGLLGGGPLLILAGVVLIKIMFGRVKFFALEFGNDGFFGRAKVIAPFIFLGSLLFLAGVAGTWLGWQAQGYSVTLNANGVTEITRGETLRYSWEDVSGRADHIKSTDFWLAFTKDDRRCRLQFQQRFIGEKLQDKAIAIAENSLSFTSPRR